MGVRRRTHHPHTRRRRPVPTARSRRPRSASPSGRPRVAGRPTLGDRRRVPPAVLWFRRDLRLQRQPCPARGARGRPGRGRRAVRRRPGPVASRRPGAAGLPRPVAARPRRVARRPARRARTGDPATSLPALARRVGRRRSTWPPTSGRTGRARDAAVAQRLDGRGHRRWSAPGSPYAVAPGRVTQGRRHALPRLHAVPPGLARPRLAGARPRARTPTSLARAPTARAAARRDRPPAAYGCRRPARRLRSTGGTTSSSSGALDRYAEQRDRPDLVGTSGLSAALRWGEIHPRTLLADLGDCAGSRGLPQRAGLARVLRRRPPPPAGLRPQQPAHRARRHRGRRGPGGRRAVRRLGRGPHRLPLRRRRHAPAARRGLDAQPGPHGHGLLPRQGPAPGLDPRRAALHALAARRRPRLATSTAGSGSRAPAPMPRRTSGSSTPSPRACATTPTATTSAGTSPSWPAVAGRRGPRAVDAARRAARRLPATRIVDHADGARRPRWRGIRRSAPRLVGPSPPT